MLAPVHVALVPLIALGGDGLAARYRLPYRFWFLAFGVLGALLICRCVVATRFAAEVGARGLEQSSLERSSQLLAVVRGLPDEAEVYSNYSAMTSFLANRPVWPLAKATEVEGAYVAHYNYKWRVFVDRLPSEAESRIRLRAIHVGARWGSLPAFATISCHREHAIDRRRFCGKDGCVLFVGLARDK